ncbi:MAG TPA: radical SAM protein [Bryobacteraceae bacterium]|nr:radical SAM protein [Bryobacteraceae bacterium]
MPELVGIARLAAESPRLESKRRVEYFDLPARSFLTKVASGRVPFRWTINPYRGCEFGCKYCYARYAHEFMELRDPLYFERKIFVKQFDAERFREELKRLPVGEPVALGTATDPYQPVERRYRITQAILGVFAETAGLRLGITTKSQLVARDIDLLCEISRRHYLTVSMTVTTVDRDLSRALEPMAPRPDLRLAAVQKLSRAGIRAGVFSAPILPLINDSETSLDELARAASAAGARAFGGNVLFLQPCAREVFLPFLEENFPLLVRRYRERFSRTAYLRGDYPERVKERVARIRRRYGFDQFPVQPEPDLWPRDPQLSLFEI